MPKKHPKLNRKKGLYLKDTKTTKGRGVFCVQDIRKGEILEITPAILLNEKDTHYVDKTFLLNYTFTAGNVSKRLRKLAGLKNKGKASSVIMGIATFCNHSEEPNAEVLYEEKQGTLYHYLQATKRIPKNTEICTSYGSGWFDDR